MSGSNEEGVPSAGQDFYRHCNAKWLDDPTIVIPPEYSRWGSFMILVDESLKNQIALLDEVNAGRKQQQQQQQLAITGAQPAAILGKIWETSMKRFEMWERGEGDYAPVQDELATLSKTLGTDANNSEGLARYLARCQTVGISKPFSFDKEANLVDSENIVLDLSPSGLSLPSRDYYIDAKFSEQRDWFQAHLEEVAGLVGRGSLQDDFAARVIRFETKLAMINMKPDQRRSFDKYFTVTTLDDLVTLDGLNALAYFEDKDSNYPGQVEIAAKVGGDDAAMLSVAGATVEADEQTKIKLFLETVVEELGLRPVMESNYLKNYPEGDPAGKYRLMVFDGDYFRRIFKLLFRATNRDDIVAYLQYKVIRSGNEFCTKALNDSFFDFYARKLRGQKEQKTAEKRTVNLVNEWVDELMGKLYVEKHFSPNDKANVVAMITEVLDIMRVSLETNDWLTNETKGRAQQKLAKFVVKIGYPDKWRNYDTLQFEAADELFAMQQKVNAFDHRDEFLDKLNTRKDKLKWEMSPQTVNAYFHPLNNEIVFPAAIIQPPFFHNSLDTIDFPLPNLEDAVPADLVLAAANFGGIGAVIAHEITHGYDDQGRKFDEDGNTKDWWQPEDAELFEAKTKLMAEQVATYAHIDEGGKEHSLNAELTMGENLADLGGLSLGCQGLRKRIRDAGIAAGSDVERKLFEVFFRSWASIWKCKISEADKINQLATDPHSPTEFRTNLVKNVDDFYEVFGVTENDAMGLSSEKRVRMW